MKRYYCTYFDRNYLVKALALIESLNQHEKNEFTLFVVCMDEITRVILKDLNLKNVTLIPLHELEERDVELFEAKKNRSLVEYYWTLTPAIILKIIERHPEIDVLTYLDADLYFFSSPDPIFLELADNSILIHEHRFSPSLAYLEAQSGKYNVGLLSFRNNEQGISVLEWWRARCIEWCYWRFEDGKMGDQMYLNDWPERFAGVVVLQHKGAAVAPWNHEQYRIMTSASGQIMIDDAPLVFYHMQFLGFVVENIILPTKHLTYPLSEPLLRLCYLPYVEALSRAIGAARTALRDFSFGIRENIPLTQDHTFFAKKNLRGVVKEKNIPQALFEMSDAWDCYYSKQVKNIDNNLTGDISDTATSLQPEVKILWESDRAVHSEEDLLIQLRGRNICDKIKVLYVVGAHAFQERVLLDNLFPQLEKIYLFEPIPEFFNHLRQVTKDDQRIKVFPYAISDSDGKAEFYLTNNDAASSSLLPLGKHKEMFPQVAVVKTIKVDAKKLGTVISSNHLPLPDMLFLDVQGAEYRILSSISSELLSKLSIIYTEVSTDEVYKGAKPLATIREMLAGQFAFLGFAPITNNIRTHGNALFVNTGDISLLNKKDSPTTMDVGNSSTGYLVSAIVSAYNSARFIRGCIEDLEAQTIADKLEIVIVDSCSPQNERAIVEEFQKQYSNIKYIRTEIRETVYSAWNRGIKAASGKYITNANTDDRHRHDAFEVMVNELEKKQEIALVYADLIMTEKENETFDRHTPCGNFKWHDWDRNILLEKGCFMGPQPMWRRSVHYEYGYFDESMVTSGDYEFWLRISQTHNFYHITTPLGLYLKSPESIEHKNREKQREENHQILSLYRVAAQKARVIKSEVVKGIPTLINPEFIKGLTSIIIPVQSIHLDECLLSIKKHTDKPHEIIFLDHGAAPKLKKQIAKAIKDNRNYKAIKIDRKVNFTQSLNVGINQSTGEYIVLLFDDVFVGEGWVADMMECLHSGKKIGIVGAMSNDASSLQRVEGIDFNSPEKRLSFRERNRHRIIYTRNIDGFCLLFKRDLLIQIDLFDEIFGADKHVFDDFCVRAVLEGYSNVIAGNVFVHNRGGINRLLSRDKTLFDEKWIGLDASTPLAEKVLIANSMELACSQYHKGAIVDSVQTLIARIGFSPNERRLFYQIAEILLAENKFQEALDALKGMAAAEDDAVYYALLGYGNEGLGLYEAADDYVDKALAIDGKSAPALNLKGILAYKKDEMKKAEEYFRRAIETDPGFGEPYTNIGMLRWKAEQKEEAIDFFEKGFILFPDKGDLVTAYYNAISFLELYGRAENIFLEARAAYPENKRVLFLLIDIFLKQGKFPDAMQEVEKAMVQFGMDTGILSAALEIRKKIGAKTIAAEGGKAKNAPTLSVCMIVKNEQQRLAYCLNSLSPVADEMIVVDTGSADKTKEIAEAFGARVFDIEWTNDFAVARNYSLSKAQGDWILVMDADEVISFQDYAKLKKLISKKDKIAYNIITRNYVNKTAGDGWTCNDNTYIYEQAGRGWFPSGKVRLFPNNEKIRFENPIHELLEHSIQRIGMGKQESGIPVHHYGELDAKKATAKDVQYYELGVKKMKKSGGDFKSVWELAVQAGELEKFEESIELWQKVLGFKQREATAYFNMANHYLKLGKHEDSYDCSRKSYALDPKDQSAVLSYAMSEFLAGDINKSISTLEIFLKGTDTQHSLVGLLAVSYLLAGEKDRGLKYLRGLVKKKYNCVYYFKDLSQSLIAAGNFARAKALLTTAIEIKFYDQQTSALLAQCESNVG